MSVHIVSPFPLAGRHPYRAHSRQAAARGAPLLVDRRHGPAHRRPHHARQGCQNGAATVACNAHPTSAHRSRKPAPLRSGARCWGREARDARACMWGVCGGIYRLKVHPRGTASTSRPSHRASCAARLVTAAPCALALRPACCSTQSPQSWVRDPLSHPRLLPLMDSPHHFSDPGQCAWPSGGCTPADPHQQLDLTSALASHSCLCVLRLTG